MEIKCNNYPNLYYSSRYRYGSYPLRSVSQSSQVSFGLNYKRPIERAEKIGKIYKEKTAEKSAVFFSSYLNNIKHTIEHKIYFAMIEKELFGKMSIDSLTHDSDKLLLYILGFPKKFVSKFHRKHSVHHIESHKTPNLRSMLCDNIASSPEFKPEKTMTVREFYSQSKELQNVKGFGEILEKYNFGENLDFTAIKAKKLQKENNARFFMKAAAAIIPFI